MPEQGGRNIWCMTKRDEEASGVRAVGFVQDQREVLQSKLELLECGNGPVLNQMNRFKLINGTVYSLGFDLGSVFSLDPPPPKKNKTNINIDALESKVGRTVTCVNMEDGRLSGQEHVHVKELNSLFSV